MPTWATMPSPKNVETRRLVLSTNWSGTTRSSGRIASFMLPTALTEMIDRAPSARKPQTFAR